MSHLDEADLSLIALGEPAGQTEQQHLDSCPYCRERLAELDLLVISARSVTPADRPVAPPAAVWSAIVAELRLPTALDAGSSPEPGVIAAGESMATPSKSATGPASDPFGAVNVPVTSLRRRTRRSTWLVAAAAAAAGVVTGVLGTRVLSSSPEAPQVVATADLSPLADGGVRGVAAVKSGPGGDTLSVGVPGLPPLDDGYYEVWMATADTSKMVAIGTLGAQRQGSFDLPPGMDVASFPVVDVSVEHFDGQAGHSAVSVVRGTLHS